MKRKLTPKQRKFANEFIKTNNAYQSAISAGYSKAYAKNAGKFFIALAKAFHDLAVQTSRKREEQEVKEALQSSIDKRKKEHDEFHKFVRSL